MRGYYLWPSTPVGRHIVNFCDKSVRICRNKLQEYVCQVSGLYFLFGIQKLAWHMTMKAPISIKNGTFYRPSTSWVLSKFQIFMLRCLRNRTGQSQASTTEKILILPFYGVVGQWKLTKCAAIGVLRGSVTRELMENATSWSILGVRSSNLAQIEAGLKLHPMKASWNQITLFLRLHTQPESTVKCQKGLLLLRGCISQPHSIARPTFLYLD